MDFKVVDQVLLKVSHMKGVMRFVKRWKFNPWYIGLFEALNNIGLDAF